MARAGAEERRRALALLAEGRTVAEAAEAVGAHPATVARWRKAAEGGGPPPRPEAGARPRGNRPRPPRERRMSVNFYLPVSLVASLDARAQREGAPVSAVVERALRAELDR